MIPDDEPTGQPPDSLEIIDDDTVKEPPTLTLQTILHHPSEMYQYLIETKTKKKELKPT